MNVLTVDPSGPLHGTVRVPGDKSITHRAIMLSALASGETSIVGYCPGEDCLNTAKAFREMGIRIDLSPTTLRVSGKGPWGLTEPQTPLDCGNSGTGIRLLTGLLAGQDFFTVLTGDASIRRRPMGRIVKPLREMGATVAGRKGGELAPIAVIGTRLRAIDYALPVASAQVKSALLLAGLYAEGTTHITEPAKSRDHTERMFRYFGIPVEQDSEGVRVTGRPTGGWVSPGRLVVPGDLSSAAFFIVAATIVPHSDITLLNVGVNPTRTGILDLLAEMGAQVQWLHRREEGGEPVADLRVRSAALQGIRVGPERVPATIDEFPILCVAAAAAEGRTEVVGAHELRVKESDRIATMAAELRTMGVRIEETPDGLIIDGMANRLFRGSRCASHGDHRVAMALAIAAMRGDGPTQIEDVDCIETSFPGFNTIRSALLTGQDRSL